MSSFLASCNLVLKRMARNGRLLVAAVLGVTIATALLSSAPPYATAVTEFGLRRALHSADPADSHVQATSFQRGLDRERYAALDRVMDDYLQGHFEQVLAGVVRSVTSRRFVVWKDGVALPRTRASVVFYEALDEHVRLSAGLLPEARPEPGGELQAVVSGKIAERLGLAVGDRLELGEQEGERPGAPGVRVVGIVEALAPYEPYWMGRLSPLEEPTVRQWNHEFSLLVTRDTFFEGLLPAFPRSGAACTWNLLFNLDRIHAGNWTQVSEEIQGLKDARTLKEASFRIDTGLPEILASYRAKWAVARVVLLVLTIEITALVIYFILMTSSLLIRQQSKEIAVLKSRGASLGQVGGMQALEALLIAGLAAIAGPFLALAFLRLLPHLGLFAGLAAGPAPTFALSPSVFLLALAGAALSWAALFLPTLPVARSTLVTFQQGLARPPRAAFWQRYYLDVFLIILGGVAFWRLRTAGPLLSGARPGGPRLDPLLLASPALLMLGGALIFLRAIPLLLSGLARLGSAFRTVSPALSVWHLARNPVHYSRLVLLLALAVALGLFASGFSATLANSYTEQARYRAGADLRVSTRQPLAGPFLRSLPGVRQVSLALRTTATAQAGRFSRFDLLAADLTLPDTGGQPSFLQVTRRYRADYAPQPLEVLFGQLAADAPDAPPGLPLPGEPSALGVWAYALPNWKSGQDWLAGNSDLERTALGAKLVDGQGQYWAVAFVPVPAMTRALPGASRPLTPSTLITATAGMTVTATLRDPGWQYLRAQIVPEEGAAPAYPLHLVSLTFTSHAMHRWQNRRPDRIDARLYLDDLGVEQPDGRVETIEGFESEDAQAWQPLSQGAAAGAPSRPLAVRVDEATRLNGRRSLLLDMSFAGSQAVLGLAMGGAPASPVALLASDRFLTSTGLEVGDDVRAFVEGTDLTFKIVGALHYFPTLYDDEGAAFAVCNRDRLLSQLNAYPATLVQPNEAWLDVGEGADVGRLAASLAALPGVEQVWQPEEVWRDLHSEPLALGLEGIFTLGYAVALILSIVGFTFYFGLTARQRSVEFGVLRAIGLSPLQLLALLSIEQAVLIALGLGAGTVLGLGLGRLVLPFMAISFEGRQVVPPLWPAVDWSAIQGLYATLLAAFLLAFAAATFVLYRMKITQALTMGEE